MSEDNTTPTKEETPSNQILTYRPKEMDYVEYRVIRKYQGTIIKKLFARKPDARILGLMGVRPGYNQHGYYF